MRMPAGPIASSEFSRRSHNELVPLVSLYVRVCSRSKYSFSPLSLSPLSNTLHIGRSLAPRCIWPMNKLCMLTSLAIASATWEQLVATNIPLERRGHTAVWDAVGSQMLVYGGEGGRRRITRRNELYSLDPVQGAWTELSASGNVVEEHTAAWDAASRTMYIHGGSSSFVYDDLDGYAVGSGWTAYQGGYERRFATAVWNSEDEELLVYGGWTSSSRTDTLLVYSSGTNSWTSTSGAAAGLRSSHMAVWDASTKVMLVFGGYDGSNVLSDLWGYARDGDSWSELFPSGSLPVRRHSATAVWDQPSRLMFVFGGMSGTSSGYLDDPCHHTQLI